MIEIVRLLSKVGVSIRETKSMHPERQGVFFRMGGTGEGILCQAFHSFQNQVMRRKGFDQKLLRELRTNQPDMETEPNSAEVTV